MSRERQERIGNQHPRRNTTLFAETLRLALNLIRTRSAVPRKSGRASTPTARLAMPGAYSGPIYSVARKVFWTRPPQSHGRRLWPRTTNARRPVVEFASALARIVRMQELDDAHAEQITGLFQQECRQGLFYKMALNTGHYEQAKMWLSSRVTALRTLDALHLACSRSIRAEMVTADRTLHAAARQLDVRSRLLA